MKIYINNNTEPYFNLAAEEYLLDNINGEIFMLWRNEPSVIIGRSQNAYAELNSKFIRENNIKVVRRLTGGGAVFHDLGNINFSFIKPRDEINELDFSRFIGPIIVALRKLGVEAEFYGRNDIVVITDGEVRKISGNAQCVRNNKIMHHGTLLYNADISSLAGALNVDPEKIKSKGIKSVRSRVANIKDYLNNLDMDVIDFMDFLLGEIPGERVEFTKSDINAIQKLANEKYKSWDYIYGVSREFSTVRKKYFDFGTVEISFSLDKGLISEICIQGDLFGIKDVGGLCAELIGVKCEIADLTNALSGVGEYIMGASPGEIAELIV